MTHFILVFEEHSADAMTFNSGCPSESPGKFLKKHWYLITIPILF